MESPLIDLAERHTVVFKPKAEGGAKPVYDPVTQTTTFPDSNVPAVTLEVFLFPRGQGEGRGGEQPGLELSEGRLTMQIVGTEGDAPLKLPANLGAGDKGKVTLLGRPSQLEIQALAPAQNPEVSDENGWLYYATLEAVT